MRFLTSLALAAVLASTAVLSADINAVCDRRNVYDVSTLGEGDRFVFTSHDEFGSADYDPDTQCIRKFHKGSCETLSIECDAFHLINGDERRCRDGDNLLFNNREEVKIRVCGESIDPIETSANADLKVTFTSDASDEAGGFRCFASCKGSTSPPPVDDGSCLCGQAMPLDAAGRIVGGEETGVSEYPWQAGIVPTTSNAPFCGGTVIGDKWVLSAAHCFINERGRPSEQPGTIRVALGDHDHRSTRETDELFASVERIIAHPDYNPTSSDNDYALLELVEAVDWASFPHIRPACLPKGEIQAGQDATVSGWGNRVGNGDDFPRVLHAVDVPVITNDQCKSLLGRRLITDNMICAGNVEDGGVDSCQGDSGGPLVQDDGQGNYEIQGVVSFGFGCADAGYPGVYASVKAKEDWIEATTGLSGDGGCPRKE